MRWLPVMMLAVAASAHASGPAEELLDAFYAFDADRVSALVRSPEERASVLYYMRWAEGANYRVHTRWPCVQEESELQCAVTVVDDFGRALGYVATDRFTLTVQGDAILNVRFEGDDPPIFQQLFGWMGDHRPVVMSGVCRDAFAGGETPEACARAVADAARAFAE